MDPCWSLPKSINNEQIKFVSRKLHVAPIIAQLLLNRKLNTVEKAMKFFQPTIADLHDPFLMIDMEKAVERIAVAVRTHEKIMIFGDYDVDGITSVSLLYHVLVNMGCDMYYYIPDRIQEGYGLSINGIDEAKRIGATLIITVDCGITAVDESHYARNNGIDLIITDHHEPSPVLPEAVAIIDPKRVDCNYPFKELAGVGVAYKLAHSILTYLDIDISTLNNHLDLVALGSIADIVPLIGENRILSKFGLKQIERTEKIGLKALITLSRLDKKPIGSGQVMFVLAPRINAGGRIGDAAKGVRLLTTDDPDVAFQLAEKLERENRLRKTIDEKTFAQAQEMIKSSVDFAKERVIVLESDDWHPGIIGIVSSRIVEKYYLPTILISMEGDSGRGSARSIPGFHLYNALKDCSKYLQNFGGHKYAAGLSIHRSNIAHFRRVINEIATREMSSEMLTPVLELDGELNLRDIKRSVVQMLKLFSPYGPQNPKPVMFFSNVELSGTPHIVGNNHLKFKVRQEGRSIDCIGFDMGHYMDEFDYGKSNIDLVGIIEENYWNGKWRLQIRAKDMRIW
jgi:single-stranded-DNA-specific exonuclease